MIGVTSSGHSFRALARYLAVGRSGQEVDRVAWTASRNLPTSDPELAAKFMRATAEQSHRVQKPVYHLAISFDRSDHVGRAEMERVVDAVLRRLKLEHHQALLVSHHDRDHPHVHILVNRIHPETGKAWERWKDRPIIEQVLREEERALGLRQINGRLAPVAGHEVPDRIGSHDHTSSERRVSARLGDAPFIERVRAHVEELRKANTWEALEKSLAEQGLRLEPKGQGFVVTDGMQYVKASRIARDFSRHALEQRFGVAYGDRSLPQTSLDHLARDIRRYAYLTTLTSQALDATVRAEQYRATINTTERRSHASAAFDHILVQMYTDPRSARRAFDISIQQHGLEATIRQLQHNPEHFGSLQNARNVGGVLRYIPDRMAEHLGALDNHRARALVPRAAELGRAAALAHQAETRAAERLRDDTVIANRRTKQVRAEMQSIPGTATLERAIASTLQRLLPDDLRRLQTMITQPQFALALKVRRTVKDIALGRDESGREQ